MYGHRGSTSVSQEAERREGKAEATAVIRVSTRKAWRGSRRLGLASLNNSAGLWGTGVVPCCLYLDLG